MMRRKLQMAGCAMRAYPGKTVARLLLFAEDMAAESIGHMLHEYNSESQTIAVGVVANNFKAQVASSTPGRAREAMASKGRGVECKV